MKKLLLPLTFCLPIGLAAQVSIAPIIGLNMSGYEQTASFYAPDRPGFSAGLMTDIKLTSHLYLQPGISLVWRGYEHKGSIYGETDTTLTIDATGWVNSIEMPVTLTYKTEQVGSGRFTFSAGPYLVWRLWSESNTKITDARGKVLYDGPAEFNYWYYDRRKLNLGMTANAGYELNNGLFVRIFYGLGLLNNARNNYSYGLAAGYLINKKDKKSKNTTEAAQ